LVSTPRGVGKSRAGTGLLRFTIVPFLDAISAPRQNMCFSRAPESTDPEMFGPKWT
jgi:hypothetical protein